MLDPRIMTVVRRAAGGPAASVQDAVLVKRFVDQHDEAAFTEIVARHGPAVWALCRRVLRSEPDAEDAFQATFLLLARRAGQVRKAASVGSWLHGVAVRLSRRLRQRRPLDPNRLSLPQRPPDPADNLTWAEVRAALDEELARLPDHLRAPLLLCYYRGLTQDEAAAELGWKARTLKARVARGRKLLRCRLTRRGVELPAALAAPLLAAGLSATVPRSAVAGLIVAAVNTANRLPPGPGVSAAAVELARTGLTAMTPIRIAAVAVSAAALLTVGTVFGLRGEPAREPGPDAPSPPGAAAPGQATWQEAARLFGQAGYVNLSPDGRVLATFAENDQIVFWDAETWKEQARYDIRARYGSSYLGYLPFAPDGRTVAVFGWAPLPGNKNGRRQEITLIDPTTGRERGQMPGEDAAFSPVGQLLAVRFGDALVLWDMVTAKEIRRLPDGSALRTNRLPMAFSPDGSLLYVTSKNGGQLFDVVTGATRGNPAGDSPKFSPDGRTLATRQSGPEVKLWDTATGLLRATVRGIAAPGVTFEFSPDSRVLLTSGYDVIPVMPEGELDLAELNKPRKAKTMDLDVRIWDVANGTDVVRLPGRIRLLRPGRFTSDGRTVVYQRLSGDGDDMEVVLWDVAGRKERLVLREPGGIDIPFMTAEGATLFGTVGGHRFGSQGGLRAWDLATGRELPRPPGDGVAAHSADGRLLVELDVLPGSKVGEAPKYELRAYRHSATRVTTVIRGTKPEPEPQQKKPTPATLPGREWQVLSADDEAANQEFGREFQAAKTAEQQRELGAKRSAAVEGFAARAIDLARKHPGAPEAVEALSLALRYTNGGTDGTIATLGRSAVALVKQNYMTSEQLGQLVPWLTHQQREDAEDLLQTAFEKSPHAAVRGRAAFWLARTLTERAEAARLLRQMPEIADSALVRDRPTAIARVRATDPDGVERRAERLYEILSKDYADVTEQVERPDKIGPGADRALFALRNLSLGRTVPDIEGKDLDGKPLKLSDYRGKVVVVIFCGDWCGPCKAMKPHLRDMVKKLSDKPFQLLEVNSDEDAGAVKDRMKLDGNAWPCWFDDGREGPIHRRWNVTRWPTVFVVDGKGVIRFKELRDEPLQRAVEQILKE